MNRSPTGRVASNNATFRAANEKIREAAELYDARGLVPFVCECADGACRSILRITLDAYREIRSNGHWFLSAVGHEGSDTGSAVVAERDGYVVVEKSGAAGEPSPDDAPSQG